MTILNFNEHKPAVELSNQELIYRAPSIGATMPAPGTSDKYSFIPTIKAVDFIRDAGWIPVGVNQSKTRLEEKSGFQRHSVTFTKPDFDLGDRRLEMNLYNSHDAGSSYILSGGIYRLVCSNGMVVGRDIAEYCHRHMNFDADMFIESARFVAENMQKVATRLFDWEAIQLSPNEQGIFAQAAHEIMFDGKAHSSISPEQLLIARRSTDEKNDLWTTLNRIQENVIKGGLQGKSATGRRSKTRKVTDIKRDKNLNQALWTMAEKIASYKQAA